jgi:hypothetical protein
VPVIEQGKARTAFAVIVISRGIAAIRINPEFAQIRP